jgi:uncharacterized protein (DUF302 family)
MKERDMNRILLAALTAFVALPALADSIAPRAGWAVYDSTHSYAELVDRVKAEVAAEPGLIVVTEAGPTQAAAARGITIPGNRVIGVYGPDYAVRAIRLSVPAMIEAPIRMYVTEDSDGSATLSYKTPTLVFSPYFEEGGGDLKALATELDGKFAAIAERAVK